MPEDIGTSSFAATFDIVGKFMKISVIASVYIALKYNLVYDWLLKIPCFRRKNSYIQCFMTAVITILLMIFIINWFCPVFTSNLQPYVPRSCYELFVQHFVVSSIVCLIIMNFDSILVFSTNCCYLCTIEVLIIMLSFYLVSCNTCAALNVIIVMLKELQQLY